MRDNLREALKDMDAWIAGCGDGVGAVKGADVMKWRAAFVTALDRLDKLEQASQSALDAYLLRPHSSPLQPRPSTSQNASARQKHFKRLALAMATLENELAAARNGVEPYT